MRFPSRAFSVLAACLALVGTGREPAAQAVPGQATPAIRPQPIGGIVINEVLFDGVGADGGTEAIELFNTSANGKSLAGLVLADQSGAALFFLPSQTLPAGGYVVVQLGPVVPELLDTNPSDGKARFFTGGAPLDRLANAAGGVVLSNQSQILDAVFWGTSGPPSGSQYSAAVSAGKWPAGGFVNISFSGGSPLFEGESIGRDTMSTDTDKVANWATSGGKNSMGSTLALRNDMYVFTEDQLVFLAQGAVNEALGAISFANNFNIDVLGASHSNVVVDDPDSVGGFAVTAAHDIVIVHDGATKHLTGSLTVDFERVGTPGATSYSLATSGTLSAPDGTSIALNQSRTWYGFHGTVRTEITTSLINWTEYGSTYSFAANGTNQITLTADDSGSWSYSRSGSDWGGAGTKSMSATVDYVKVSDGVYQLEISASSSNPILPPPFGQTQTLIGTREVDSSMTVSLGADKEQTRTIHTFHVAFLDSSGAQTYEEVLSAPGSFSQVRTAGDEFSMLGTWSTSLQMDVQYDWPVVFPSSPGYSKTVQGTTVGAVQNNEIVSQTQVDLLVNSNLIGSMSFFVDGPPAVQGCGCGCGDSGCSCGGATEASGFEGQTGLERAYTGLGLVGCVGSIVYLAGAGAITGGVGFIGAGGMALYCGAIAWFGGGF
jgi:hypothetical protein